MTPTPQRKKEISVYFLDGNMTTFNIRNYMEDKHILHLIPDVDQPVDVLGIPMVVIRYYTVQDRSPEQPVPFAAMSVTTQ